MLGQLLIRGSWLFDLKVQSDCVDDKPILKRKSSIERLRIFLFLDLPQLQVVAL